MTSCSSGLHYELDAWMGDDLVQTFPCYLATEKLQANLAAIHPTGLKFAAAEVTTSETFRELHPETAVPRLVWLQISGVQGKDDFGLTGNARIVVSDRVLRVMQTTRLNYCDVEDFTG